LTKAGARKRQAARYLLASIRLVNGTAGLVAPQLLIRRFDGDVTPSPGAIYAFRLFGIRTILLGLGLLTTKDDQLQRALREGVVIHASDVATVTLLGVRRQLPPRTAVLIGLISVVNVALAVASLERNR
jgi:hypothetical protein